MNDPIPLLGSLNQKLVLLARCLLLLKSCNAKVLIYFTHLLLLNVHITIQFKSRLSLKNRYYQNKDKSSVIIIRILGIGKE